MATLTLRTRIAHPGRGPFGEHRIRGGARFRIQQPFDRGHPVGLLLPDVQIAPPGPFGVVGQLAVLIEQQRQPVGGLM